jgi:hypothetical protein
MTLKWKREEVIARRAAQGVADILQPRIKALEAKNSKLTTLLKMSDDTIAQLEERNIALEATHASTDT